MQATVLVVEDDQSLRRATADSLRRASFEVLQAGDGDEAIRVLAARTVDLVVLDVMLPTLDGFEVCRIVRRTSQLPIIMLTALADTTDVVAGLELGANDYVSKPFESAELVARIRAALRRDVTGLDEGVISAGDLTIDVDGFRVCRGDESIELTSTEFRLLAELARAPGKVLSRETLLGRVWGYDYLGDSRLVDMAVKRVRDKLGDDPRTARYIATVRRAGYRFEG